MARNGLWHRRLSQGADMQAWRGALPMVLVSPCPGSSSEPRLTGLARLFGWPRWSPGGLWPLCRSCHSPPPHLAPSGRPGRLGSAFSPWWRLASRSAFFARLQEHGTH
eukprot:10652141-Alexandrium_andersonii.AAC.1